MKIVHYKERDAYHRELDAMMVEIAYAMIDKDMTNGQIANLAGLCRSTVDKIFSRQTEYPRFKTVWSLAKAVGMSFTLVAPKKFHKKGRAA